MVDTLSHAITTEFCLVSYTNKDCAKTARLLSTNNLLRKNEPKIQHDRRVSTVAVGLIIFY